jgi:hypothetical protein
MRVGENCIGESDFLKFGMSLIFGLRGSLVYMPSVRAQNEKKREDFEALRTWVMFECLLPICRFDLICSHLRIESKDFVRIDRRRRVICEIIALLQPP